MAQTREVIHKKSVGVSPTGEQVVREKTQVSSPEVEQEVERKSTVLTVNRLIFYLTSVIEVLLGFRFVLKILGANPGSPFVAFVYTMSGLFEAPFRGIFRTAVTEGIETRAILEPSTVVAILVYAVLALGIVELVKLLSGTHNGEDE